MLHSLLSLKEQIIGLFYYPTLSNKIYKKSKLNNEINLSTISLTINHRTYDKRILKVEIVTIQYYFQLQQNLEESRVHNSWLGNRKNYIKPTYQFCCFFNIHMTLDELETLL
ncbi:unnamed protein product [Paramecium octaurelia]|uniref:Uncharacterized protein n=1 Tax=Paramecium octaurelia TaxID=43137 RepID=A0A8S1TF77_PAROT|nr:unnamed protein product [Paramecium octaurelia]